MCFGSRCHHRYYCVVHSFFGMCICIVAYNTCCRTQLYAQEQEIVMSIPRHSIPDTQQRENANRFLRLTNETARFGRGELRGGVGGGDIFGGGGDVSVSGIVGCEGGEEEAKVRYGEEISGGGIREDFEFFTSPYRIRSDEPPQNIEASPFAVASGGHALAPVAWATMTDGATVDNNVRGLLVAASLILSNGESVGVVNHVAAMRGDHACWQS